MHKSIKFPSITDVANAVHSHMTSNESRMAMDFRLHIFSKERCYPGWDLCSGYADDDGSSDQAHGCAIGVDSVPEGTRPTLAMARIVARELLDSAKDMAHQYELTY